MIAKETIALVKDRTDLVALIGESVRLTRRGASFVGLCPFHKEKSPSFHVHPDRAFFHCFGCKKTGSAVDFLMEQEGLSFTEAVRSLASRAGIEVNENTTDAERREADAKRREKEELYAVNHLAATFFEHSLRGGPGHPPHPLAHHAREELERRGLPIPSDDDALSPIADTLQAFRIGYAPHAWDGLAQFLKQQGKRAADAERVGLLVPRSSGTGFYDRFRHRLMFAVTDVNGRVLAFSGRALPDPHPSELEKLGISHHAPSGDASAPAKYINSPESPIYTKGEQLFGLHQARHAIRQAEQAILVEGNFDVVSLHARGIPNAVAPLGTAFTSTQAKLLRRYTPNITLLFDGDTAGRKATRAARGPCAEAGLSAKVAVLPMGTDPDELCRKRGPEAIRSLTAHAKGMLEYLIDDALHGDVFQGSSLAEQQHRIQAVLKLLREENDPNLRAAAKLYADRLSAQMMISGQAPTDLRQLERLVEGALQGGPAPFHSREPAALPPERARSPAREDQIGLTILGALLDFPELLDDPQIADSIGVLDGDVVLSTFALRRCKTDRKHLDAIEFLAQIPRSVHSFAAGRLSSPVFETAEQARAAVFENARKLELLSLKREKAAVVEKPNQAEALGDHAAVDAMLREAQRRAQRKAGMT